MSDGAGKIDVTMLQSRYERLEAQYELLKNNGGGGTSGGMNDDWKSSVDSQLTQLHQDVRNLLYGLIAAGVLAFGAGATAYVKISDQVTDLRVDQAQVSGKIDLLLDRTGEPPATKP